MAMAQKGLSQVAKSEQVAQIMQQIRGPLMETAQQAVLSRVSAISDQLMVRMQALTEIGVTTVEGTADTVTDTTKKTVKGTVDSTKKAGNRVQGALSRLTGKKEGKAEEPTAKEAEPEEEANESVEQDGAESRDETASR